MNTLVRPRHGASPFATQLARRAALFIGILMSGGNLLIPRVPLLVALLLLFLALRGPLVLIRRELRNIWLLLMLVLIASVVGAGEFHAPSTLTRYANFIAGLALIGIYLDLPKPALTVDILPVLRLMAIQSMLTPIAAIALSDFFMTLTYEDVSYHTFLGVFTYHETIVGSGLLKRPDGFFFEPGVLQIYLNIFLYIALFLAARVSDRILAVLGVIATQSTTGLFIMVALLGVWYLRRLVKAGAAEKIIVVLVAPLAMLPAVLITFTNYVDKTEGAMRGSFWARQYDLITGLRVLWESPWFGIGFDVNRYYEIAMRVGYRETQLDYGAIVERGSTNGIVSLAFTVGIPLFIAFMYGLFKQRFFPDRTVVAIIVLLSLLSEPLALTPFFLMIFYSGLLGSGVAARRVVRQPQQLPGPARPLIPNHSR